MKPNPRIEGRIRVAALLVLAGLVLEAVTLNILHPLSFVVFALFGVLLIGAGIIVFLLTLLVVTESEEGRSA
jgi:uncharacterized Tic20 family protein